MSKTTRIDMTSGPLAWKILLYVLPIIGTAILTRLFNTADMIVVGRYATGPALAAVGSSGPLITLIVNLFTGLATGTSVCVAHRYGAKEYGEVRKVLHTAVLASIIGGTVFGLVGFFGSRTFLIWMGTPENVLELGALYLKIYFLGMPVNMVYVFSAGVLRAVGETRRPLIFITVGGVVNVLLNLFAVIVLDMGVAGVALATLASQTVSAVLIVLYMMKQEGCIRFSFRDLRIDTRLLASIARIGVPAGVQSSMFSLANVVIQSAINSFGDACMEGAAASMNLESYMYIAMNSFAGAAMAFTGQNVGARKFDRLPKVLFACCGLVVTVGIVLGAVLLLFGNALLGIYIVDSPEAMEYGMQRLTMYAFTYFLCGFMESISGSIRGMGGGLVPMSIVFVGSCLSRVVWVYTVFAAFPAFQVLLYCYPISWILTSVMLMIAYFIYKRRLIRRITEAGQGKKEPVPA